MHTLKIDGVVFHYNSDLSGDVEIVREGGVVATSVPGSALLKFVAEHIRRETIAALEEAPADELLGVVIPEQSNPPKPHTKSTRWRKR